MGSSFLKMGIPDRPLPLFEMGQTVCFLIFLKTSNGEWQTMRVSMGPRSFQEKFDQRHGPPSFGTECSILLETGVKGEEIAKGPLRAISNRLQGLFANDAGEDPAYKTDQDGAEESSPEATYMESPDQAGHQPEHQRVDDQQKETQSDEG